MDFDAFISYGNHDRHVAENLCAFLEGRGLRCWIAPRNITSGSNYAGEITRALKSSKAIVVICSREACQSNHVKNEVTVAFNQGIRILPYCLSDNPFDDDLEYYLSSKQQIRSSGNSNKDFEQILNFLGEPLKRDDSIEEIKTPAPRKRLRPVHISGLILIFCIVAAACFLYFRNDNPNAPSAEITYDSFTGEILDGHPNGFGTYTFAQPRRIDQHDPEERMAAPGDYINGSWKNGHLDYGEWYDNNGKLKGFIQLGDHLDIESDWVLGTCEKP